ARRSASDLDTRQRCAIVSRVRTVSTSSEYVDLIVVMAIPIWYHRTIPRPRPSLRPFSSGRSPRSPALAALRPSLHREEPGQSGNRSAAVAPRGSPSSSIRQHLAKLRFNERIIGGDQREPVNKRGGDQKAVGWISVCHQDFATANRHVEGQYSLLRGRVSERLVDPSARVVIELDSAALS